MIQKEEEEERIVFMLFTPFYVSYFITYFYFAELKARLLKRFQRKSQTITRSGIQQQRQVMNCNQKVEFIANIAKFKAS